MNGILLIDKAQDWTSNDVVAKLKGILHTRRVGHSGTLDPMATGLLVVFVGRATRAVEFAEADSKRYLAGLRLGMVTDTQDISGTVLESSDAQISREELEAVLDKFKGPQKQIPPMYSAIKINGRKLYDIARRGGEVERKARDINILSLELLGYEEGDWQLGVSCSKGTYIRTLCNDIGAALGCGGCMSSLRRVSAGRFGIENAYTIRQVQEAADRGEAEKLLLPVDSLFGAYPALSVDSRAEQRIKNGNTVKYPGLSQGSYRVYSPEGEFLALGRWEDGQLLTVKSFFEV